MENQALGNDFGAESWFSPSRRTADVATALESSYPPPVAGAWVGIGGNTVFTECAFKETYFAALLVVTRKPDPDPNAIRHLALARGLASHLLLGMQTSSRKAGFHPRPRND
jgi:hypothetical protein